MPRLFVLAAAALSACARSDTPASSFPIGLYGVNDPEHLARVKKEGFDAVQSYQLDPAFLRRMDAAARREGMTLLAHPHRVMASSVPASAFSSTVWYLQDEPDLYKTPPETLLALDREVKAWAPGRATAFVVGDGRAAARYADSGDVIMVDWYPVPHLPLGSLGDHVGTTVAAAKGKPVWAVIQAFDWRNYEQKNPKKPRIGRFPDIVELRFMSYDAVIQGARGLWYFSYGRPDGSNLSDATEPWFALAQVSREIAAMAPIFARGKPTALPFTPKPEGVAAKAWRWRGRTYVVIANRTSDRMLKVPAPLLEKRWRPLFAHRRDARELLEERYGAHYLSPYRVMVFESRLWPLG